MKGEESETLLFIFLFKVRLIFGKKSLNLRP